MGFIRFSSVCAASVRVLVSAFGKKVSPQMEPWMPTGAWGGEVVRERWQELGREEEDGGRRGGGKRW